METGFGMYGMHVLEAGVTTTHHDGTATKAGNPTQLSLIVIRGALGRYATRVTLDPEGVSVREALQFFRI